MATGAGREHGEGYAIDAGGEGEEDDILDQHCAVD